MAFNRLWRHVSPHTSHFIIEFRLNASTTIVHQAAFPPNFPDGSRPPAPTLSRRDKGTVVRATRGR